MWSPFTGDSSSQESAVSSGVTYDIVNSIPKVSKELKFLIYQTLNPYFTIIRPQKSWKTEKLLPKWLQLVQTMERVTSRNI